MEYLPSSVRLCDGNRASYEDKTPFNLVKDGYYLQSVFPCDKVCTETLVAWWHRSVNLKSGNTKPLPEWASPAGTWDERMKSMTMGESFMKHIPKWLNILVGWINAGW